MSPARVCFMIDDLHVGGTEQQLLGMLAAFDRTAVQPSLCLLKGSGERSSEDLPNDIDVTALGIRQFRLLNPLNIARAVQLSRVLRRERIDVLQLYFPDSTRLGLIAGALARTPCIVGSRRNQSQRPRVQQLISRCVTRRLDATIANCAACRDAAVVQDGAAPESVRVIGNGIDRSRLEALPPWTRAVDGPDRPRLGLLANLRPVKRPDLLVKAMPALAERYPDLIGLLAGGGDSSALMQTAQELGVEPHVNCVGHVEDVPGFLAGLDVAVLCSHAEGQSNALLEYMAAGRPIVATAVGGTPDLVRNGVEGLLVPPDDPKALSQAILRLLDDPPLARRLAAAAQRKAESFASFEDVAKAHMRVYTALLARARTPSGPSV